MSTQQPSTCPQCGEEIPASSIVCPHCKPATGIISLPLDGAPEAPPTIAQEAPASTPTPSADLAPVPSPPLTPPVELLPPPAGHTQAYWMRTSFTSVSSSAGPGDSQVRTEVRLDLPRETVDPQALLSADEFRGLMDLWDDEIGLLVASSVGAATPVSAAQAAGQVALPFAAAGLQARLPLAEQEAMTQRAQSVAKQLLSLPASLTGFPPVFDLEQLPAGLRAGGVQPDRPRRAGVSVSCGGVLAALLGGAALVTWLIGSALAALG